MIDFRKDTKCYFNLRWSKRGKRGLWRALKALNRFTLTYFGQIFQKFCSKILNTFENFLKSLEHGCVEYTNTFLIKFLKLIFISKQKTFAGDVVK